MQLTIQDINSAIMFGNFTNDQLNSITMAVKYARAQLTQAKRREFRVGDAVKFVNSRNGQTYIGTVDRVKLKNVLVKTSQGRWNVPANMLEAA
jgi:hypothetical protein